MKTAIRFLNTVKQFHGAPFLRIHNLRIHEHESVAFYGLTPDYAELMINLMTCATFPDEGTVTIFETDSKDIADEKVWFRIVQDFGVYSAQPPFQEGASIGENLATLYRFSDESAEEPQLSSSVLRLANLVQLTITDLSKIMKEATSSLRMKVRLARALAHRPRVVVFVDPTEDLATGGRRQLVELIRRARRRRRFTRVIFTSDARFLEELADRVIFLNPQDGLFIENQLRGWYHKLFPFLSPSHSQLLQLSQEILRYGSKTIRDRIEKH
jgi:ABC-type multidrug transport system ATPase subunit